MDGETSDRRPDATPRVSGMHHILSPDLEHLASWYKDAGEIVGKLGSDRLPDLLDLALGRLVSFDLSVVFAYTDGARPLHLFDGFRNHDPGPALDRYLGGAFLVDPFYTACSHGIAAGLYRMRDLAPDGFFEGSYVGNADVHPCISLESGTLSEEIGYVADLDAGFRAAYSLMRSNGSPPFSDAEFDRLKCVEPVVLQVLRRHYQPELQLAPAAIVRPIETSPPIERGEVLEKAFATFGEDVLSLRERMVTQMILRGHSAHSIAATLSIAEGTVKNHRKSVYAKLGTASQQELFSLFLSHVLGCPPTRLPTSPLHPSTDRRDRPPTR